MILYKYLPCNEYTFKALSSRGLWCNKSNTMNDPFENIGAIPPDFTEDSYNDFYHFINGSDNEFLQYLSSVGYKNTKGYFANVKEKMLNEYTFCSLSGSFDNILMWSHYANAHKGIVLGIEIDEFALKYSLQKVNYVDYIEDIDILNYAKLMSRKSLEDSALVSKIFSDISIKTRDWEYEQEYRIWAKKPTYFHLKPEQYKCVYFGVNCDMETKRLVVEILRSYVKPSFQVYDMEINRKHLCLDVKKDI